MGDGRVHATTTAAWDTYYWPVVAARTVPALYALARAYCKTCDSDSGNARKEVKHLAGVPKLETVVTRAIYSAVGDLANEVGIGRAVALTVPATEMGKHIAAAIGAKLEGQGLTVRPIATGDGGQVVIVTD